MPDDNLEKLYYKTYLSVIEGSIGTNMFRHLYVRRKDTGEEIDVLNDGDLSCAIHVSGILTVMSYIDRPHATVESVLKAMEKAGWTKTKNPKQGDVILWDKHPIHGTEHLGFYWINNQAISNSFKTKTPIIHELNPDREREILGYWTRDYTTILTN